MLESLDSPWFWLGVLYWGLVWGALGAAAGKPKGRGFYGALAGFFLGPLGPALMLALDPVEGNGGDPNAPPSY